MDLLIDQPVRHLVFASIGLCARLAATATFKGTLNHRTEIITPISDWKRANEAIYLWDSGMNPYEGDLFHEYPISLQFYKLILSYFNVDLAFCVTDIITAILLHQSIFRQLLTDNETYQTSKQRSTWVFLAYLFSPLTIMSCAGQSTTIYTNFLIALILFTLSIKAFRALTCVLCALLACNNIYYAPLTIPIICCMEYSSRRRPATNEGQVQATNSKAKKSPQDDSNEKEFERAYYSNDSFPTSVSKTALICITSITALMATSYFLMGNSWSFLEFTFFYTLRIGDLKPNIGLYWYLFTEIFDQYYNFFVSVVQMLAFVHALPLTIAFRDKPFFGLYVTALASTIFQPYPSLANVGLVTSILPRYSDLFPNMQRGLYVICACITCICLFPLFWHLWIVTWTANANYYFGAATAFMSALTLLAMDLMHAHELNMGRLRLRQLGSKD